MHIRVTCPACGRAFKVAEKFAGRQGRCPEPTCRAAYRVPFEAAEEEPVASLPMPSSVRTRFRQSTAKSGPRTARRKQAAKSRRNWIVVAGACGAVVALGIAWSFWSRGPQGPAMVAEAQAAEPPPENKFVTVATPFLQKYCTECHGGNMAEAGVGFDKFTDEKALRKNRKTWQHALDLVQLGVMPPEDGTQPTPDEKAAFLAYVNHTLFHVDCNQARDPGRVTIRRLNRAEYNNTVRDLVGVNFRPADDFPSDDVGYGFDNIGDVLSLPPLLMEKYLDAAEAIARAAIIAVDTERPPSTLVEADGLQKGPAAHDGDGRIAVVSSGFVSMEHLFVVGGQYKLRASASGQQAGDEPVRMEFRLDGKPLKVFDVKNRERRPEAFELVVDIPRGEHKFAAAFINDFYDEKQKADRNLFVWQMEVAGPTVINAGDLPTSHKELLAHRPSAERTVATAVRENLRPFVTKAFRRPVRDEELDGYIALVEVAMKEGETFESAMQTALAAVLVSPHFLFRIETDRNPADPNDRHPLNDYELATRLSYFLWASLPDAELFTLAGKNELHQEQVLDAQVRRMLKDPRSQALVDGFAEQWLQLRVLNEITPDPERFAQFTPELREDLKTETKKLFEHVMREDRSLLELLTAQYTFVNERLAKHYGLPEVKGSEFQRVSLEGTQRSGLLTHGSVLTMTSNPNRTSPVKRGKWILEVILDQPPPPPPPNVPELEATKADANATLRQQLELHRSNAACASCHRMMDDLGFGLENFDAIGRWRDKDGDRPLDTTGELPGGQKFNGPRELVNVLVVRRDQFGRSVAEKLLTYALGRGLEYYDRCTTNKILEGAKADGYRFSTLVSAVIKSEPFRMRRGEGTESP